MKARNSREADRRAIPRSHRNRGRTREAVYEAAHRWRLAFAEVAHEQALTLSEIIPKPGRRSSRIRLIAEEVSRRVGFEVGYHNLREFLRREPALAAAYLEGEPPTPQARHETAIRNHRASIRGEPRSRAPQTRSAKRTSNRGHADRQLRPSRGPADVVAEILTIAAETEEASRRLNRAVKLLRLDRDDLGKLERKLERKLEEARAALARGSRPEQ